MLEDTLSKNAVLPNKETTEPIGNELNTKPESKKQLNGFMLAIAGATFWGISGTFGQFLFQERAVNVEWLITVRMLIAGIILLVFSFVKRPQETFEIWKNKKDTLQLILFGLIGILSVQYTYFVTIRHSNAATAAVLQYIGPVLIAVYLALKNRRMPKSIEILAIGLAVIGTFLLVTHGNIGTLSISKMAFFMGIASAFALAIYSLQPVKLLNKYNSGVVVGWGMLIGGVAFSFIKAPWQTAGNWDNYALISIVFIVLFGTLIAFYAYLTAVKLIGGQKSSLLASAEPLSAAILSVVWLKVPFHYIDWLGSICIISTIFILSRTE